MMSASSGNSYNRAIVQRENYFSIDDILTTQERMCCKFEVPVLNMGHLDTCSGSEHLQVGTQLELPMWLAKALGGRRRKTVAVDFPKQYKESQREILNADATVVNLHKLGPHYYLFGAHLLDFDHAECRDIAKSMQKAFQSRLRFIMDSSQNALEVESVVLSETLDEAERAIFDCGQVALTQFLQWEKREAEKLRPSNIMKNMKKRKHNEVHNNR